MSRGLTLEGLTTSYILRNVGVDTLLQAGRWFDIAPTTSICVDFCPAQTIDDFVFAAEAVEDLRVQMQSMAASKASPREFGLMVRHSPAGTQLRREITGTAETVPLCGNYSGRHLQYASLLNDRSVNDQNVKNLIDTASNWANKYSSQMLKVIKVGSIYPISQPTKSHRYSTFSASMMNH